MIDTDWLRAELTGILPKSQHAKIDRIVGLFGPDDGVVRVVEVAKSKVGIETVEAYGLVISVDANGDAARIAFPYGAEVTA